MSDQSEPKRRGRPPKDPAERKDGNLTFRTRGDLRQRLADAAKENGRSISEEVEWRLEKSLEANSVGEPPEVHYFNNIKRIVGGDDGLTEAIELGMIWRRVKDAYPLDYGFEPPWYENEETYMRMEQMFKGSIRLVLRGFAARSKREAHERNNPTKSGPPAPKALGDQDPR